MGCPTVLIGVAGGGGAGVAGAAVGAAAANFAVKTERRGGMLGAIIGGIVGVIVGAVGGAAIGGLPGAIIGGIVGAITGAATGYAMTSREVTTYGNSIVIEGTLEFRQRVVGDLDVIALTPSGGQLVQSIDTGNQTIAIVETSENDGNSYDPSTKTIEYNPSDVQLSDGSEDWMRRPPVVGFAHELTHASHDANGGLTTDATGNFSRMLEERRTVGLPAGHGAPDYTGEPFSENGIRSEIGLPQRPRY
ncbi:MAG: M91 family zinc metallopeptidase [bacterium]